jgi:predicted aspartyl protease
VALIGWFSAGRPFVDARIVMRRLGIEGTVSFFVDTGADRTILQPLDARDLHLDITRLTGAARMFGLGGIVTNFVEPASLVFETNETIYAYRLDLVIARPADGPQLPSLLGRDILNRWHMTYRPIDNRLEFEVASADSTFDLV